jgi:AraC-like DNA-binding protein
MRGKGWFSLDEGPKQDFRTGMSFINFGDHLYQFGPDADSTWEEYYVVFAGPIVERWKSRGLWIDETGPRSLKDPLKLKNRFLELFECEKINSAHRSSLVLHRLEALLLERAMQLEGHSHEYSPEVQALREQCWANPRLEMDFEKFAEQWGWSYSHLRKVFKSEVGLAPKQFLLKVRFTKAQHHLNDHRLSVAQVAEMMGYRDVYSFSRAFKSSMGISPTVYRHSSRG